MARELQIPAGVVLNRCGNNTPDGRYSAIVETYCQEQGLPILLRIPFEREIAEGIAQGKTLVEIHPETIPLFRQLFMQIISEVKPGEPIHLPINPA